MGKVTQLRIYTVKPDGMDLLKDVWQRHVVPLRKRYGFQVEGAWASPTDNVFVWMVSLQNGEEWDKRNEEYYASPERLVFPPESAQLIESVQAQLLTEEVWRAD